MESEQCNGREAAICIRVRVGRTHDERAMPAVRDRPRDRLCLAAPVPARRSGRAGGTQSCRAPAWQPDAGGHRADGLGAAPGAYALGPQKAPVGAPTRRAGAPLAGHQHHRGAAEAGRSSGGAQEALAHADEANRVWCADFKGWFRTADGQRIDPLTISDARSRYLLRCQTVEKTDTARMQAIFEAAFREYGMPQAIRTDNGPPFASRAVAGLSRLTVWWIKLGIEHERIAAGHPEQNARHERMHRTLKQETAQPPAANPREQQRPLDRFRQEFNELRPHEALEMQTPAAIYQPSARPFPASLPEPDYPRGMLVRSVRPHGHFRWKKDEIFLSEVLWGERVGLWPEDDRWFTIYFAQLPLARFDSWKLQVTPLSKTSSIAEGLAGEEDPSPSPAPHPLIEPDQKVSDMCPV